MDTQLGRTGSFDLLCSRMKLSNRICDHLDMRGCCAAATAYEFRPSLNDASGVFGHVLRRAHIDLTTTHISRQSGIGLRRKFTIGERSHFFDRVEHNRRTYAAVETDYIRAPFRQVVW